MGLLIVLAFSACKSTFPDTSWANKQWTVVEMLGVPVQTFNSLQDAHLIFNASDKTVNGSGSCNRISWSYEMGKNHSIKFGNLASTRMACQNHAFENKLLETLQQVGLYQVSTGELWLKDSKKRILLNPHYALE